jgi:signal transduction histidine kinase
MKTLKLTLVIIAEALLSIGLGKLLEDIIPKDTSFQDFEIEHEFPGIGLKNMRLNARRIVQRGSGTHLILLAIEDVTERKRTEAMVLQERVLAAQEEERKRVAHEIHDSMGASLAASKFNVESALSQIGDDHPQARSALENVIHILQGTIEEARRIQMSLRPSMLDDLGILATINWFCRQFESTYSDISIKREIDIQEHEVPRSLNIVIYRVLQEALNNVAKHSKADFARLALRKVNDRIQLMIEDNGQGFDVDEVLSIKSSKRGLGLTSMRERAEMPGGSFGVESAKGKGTTITASWKTTNASR